MGQPYLNMPAIVGWGPSDYYVAPAGEFSGNGTVFTALCICAAPQTPSVQHICGNYDAAANTGWRFVWQNDHLQADVGDGIATVTLSGASFGAAEGKWIMATLACPLDSGVGSAYLSMNGSRVDSQVSINGPWAPSAGVMSLGYDVNNAQNPSLGVIAAFGYANDVILYNNVTGLFAATYACNGMVLPGQILYPQSFIENSVQYRTRFENDGDHPPTQIVPQSKALWPSYIGNGPPLLRVGTTLGVLSLNTAWA